ncbi:hypothetical protein D3C86_1269500 [compost metagenome]
MISLRSIETTSPVSSSTKSSCQVFKTRAANLLPTYFLRPVFETLISSARSKISRISLSLSKPIALNRVVTGNFFFLSIYAYITLLISVANSIQEPLKGITLAEYNLVPFAWNDCPKKTPGDLCNCETTTRSAPLITKVPLGVI